MYGECAQTLLAFDCDGVLVDSEPIASRVLAEVLCEIGFALTAQQVVARYTGISLPAVLARIEAEWGRKLPAEFALLLGERHRAALDAGLKLFAAQCMAFAPRHCLVVEDSVAGVLAARAAGMRALGFVGGGHTRAGDVAVLLAAGALAVFNDMQDLPALAHL